MPRITEPPVQGMNELLSALRNPKGSMRQIYGDDPIALAEKLHLKLPEKPLVIMERLGLYDPLVHGPIVPGIRDLVLEVCTGKVRNAVVAANRGGGKALSLDTPLPTPTGWTTMGEVRVGDEVLAADGTPTQVVWKSKEIREDTYEVEFSDGQVIVAGGNHEWVTETRQVRQYRTNHRGAEPDHLRRKFTTRQIADSLVVSAGSGRWENNHHVYNSAPLELHHRITPVEPYLFGVWIGDGASQGRYISSGNEDLAEMEVCLKNSGASVSPTFMRNIGALIPIEGLTTQLREAGVLGKKAIPQQYLRTSRQQRLALLQGIMDTDGYCRGYNNCCEVAFKDPALVHAVAELVASLGWRYRISEHTARAQTGASYRHLRLTFRPTEQVFRLPRKVAKMRFDVAQEQRHLKRAIVDVRPIDPVPLQCIQVDHPEHMYLAGRGMIPTHNSQGVSFIEFFLVFMKDYDALNLGGSELQADQVYQYILGYIESHPEFRDMLKGESLQSKTETLMNAWIRVLTASSKSVRSPHAGGRKKDGRLAGGLLVIDEEAEAAPEIVEAALPTINTARPSVNVRCSTFHNAEGSFADVMDNAEVMGYKKYGWDIFDVAEKCDCPPGVCASPEPCFREDHVEEYIDPDTGAAATRLLHRAYCNGRAQYADGWIPMTEIETLWKRFKRNHATWEVEAMGSRPSSKGYVIKDRSKYEENKTELDGDQVYLPGWPVTIVVDWGTVAAGLECWQEQPGDRHAMIHCEQVEEAGDTQIIGKILGLRKKYEREFKEVAADIGGGGNYLNPKLRSEYGLQVRDVNFGQEKEAAVAAWNIYNEANKCIYPVEYTLFDHQIKNWKRKAGHIQKGNDHLCDAAICYFAAFVDRLGLSLAHVAPRGFSAGGVTAAQERMDHRAHAAEAVPTRLVGAGAMVRTIGSRRR